jgi:ribonuclease HI
MKLDDFDLKTFRDYIVRRGGVEVKPRIEAGESWAFTHGDVRGGVCPRKDGQHTLTGIARTFAAQQDEERRADPRNRARVAIVRLSLSADQCDLAAAMLADTRLATAYVGAAIDGDNRGGWGVSIDAGFTPIEIYGGAFSTSLARMEISSALVALKVLPAGCRIKVITDGPSLRRGLQWLDDWAAALWKGPGTDRPIPNRDLWESLHRAANRRHATFKWISVDANHGLRSRASMLAITGLQSIEQWENIDA